MCEQVRISFTNLKEAFCQSQFATAHAFVLPFVHRLVNSKGFLPGRKVDGAPVVRVDERKVDKLAALIKIGYAR